VNGRFL